jgi:hypothetical protein
LTSAGLFAPFVIGIYQLVIQYQATNTQKEQQTFELYRQILNWLTGLDFAQTHHDILSSRSPATGNWLIEGPEYKSWVLTGTGQTLRLKGILGAGKTVPASIAIDKFMEV